MNCEYDLLIRSGASREVGPHTIVTDPGGMQHFDPPRETISNRTFNLVMGAIVAVAVVMTGIAGWLASRG